MKIRLVGAELFHAEQTYGRTGGHDEANNLFFRNFSNAPKKHASLTENSSRRLEEPQTSVL